MGNTLWTFGCSFTEQDYIGGLSDYHWSTLLSLEYDLTLQNFGLSAASNDNIIFDFLQNADKFIGGDYIIVQLSHSSRLGIPNTFGGKTSFINIHPHLASVIRDAQKDKLNDLNCGPKVGKVLLDDLDQMMAFTVNIWSQRYNMNEKYYRDRVKYIYELIKYTDIKFFLWDPSIWFDFESILDWSGYNDGHWSPNGNYSFFKYLKFIFENEYNELDLWSIANKRNHFKDWKVRFYEETIKENYLKTELMPKVNRVKFLESMGNRGLEGDPI